MAKQKKIDTTELSVDELYERIDETTARLRKLRFNHAVAGLENPNVLKELRRNVARFKTELSARGIKA